MAMKSFGVMDQLKLAVEDKKDALVREVGHGVRGGDLGAESQLVERSALFSRPQPRLHL